MRKRGAGQRAYLAGLLAILVAGCSEGPLAPGDGAGREEGDLQSIPTNTGLEADPPGLRGGLPSGRDVSVAVLAGLTDRSLGGLERLRLTEYEHNVLVWPELPASRAEVNFPLDYAWYNIEIRNQSARNRLLSVYGGRDLRFQRIECFGKLERFESFQVHTDCWVTFIVDGAASHTRQLFKHLLEWEGRYKIFRYYEP